jgi:hypothetical protein
MLTPIFATDGGYVGETTRIWSDVILGDVFYNAEYITLILQNPDGVVLNTSNMTQFSTGIYYYDFIPNITGNHYAYAQVYNATDSVVGIGSTTLFIQENIKSFFGGEHMDIFLFIAVFVLFYIAGYYTKAYALIISAGVYSIANILGIAVIPQSIALNAIFLAGLGILAIYHGIYLIMTNPNRKQYVKKKDD